MCSKTAQAREKRLMEVYAAMVDRMDQGIGRLLDALHETGAHDNTVVMFLSDNGGCASDPLFWEPDHPANDEMPGPVDSYQYLGRHWGWAQNSPFRRHKGWTYEGGITTPMIVRWPGVVRGGHITHEAGHVIDIYVGNAAKSGGLPGFLPGFLTVSDTNSSGTSGGNLTIYNGSLDHAGHAVVGDDPNEYGWVTVNGSPRRKTNNG